MSHSFIDNALLSRLGSLPIESRVPMILTLKIYPPLP
jgi:hypothetical protein